MLTVDPWEPLLNRRLGAHRLTSVEVTVTHRCNMRCSHCAVGESLTLANSPHLPLETLLHSLDQANWLTSLSLTGGEPTESLSTLRDYVLPILRYSKGRGLQTQVNTNLTFDLDRYLLIAPYTDVMHISWNYRNVDDFHRIAWGHGREQVGRAASERLLGRIVSNAQALSDQGYFVSAESMVNHETAPFLGELNYAISAMGCRRHEIHPMYTVDSATDLPAQSLAEFRTTIDRFLDERDPLLWVLFGTFPFVPCSSDPDDQELLRKVHDSPNVSIRNCPDGRNRININSFTGDLFVTDFAEVPSLGNLWTDSLEQVFSRWQEHPVFARYNRYCPSAGCTGPNILVAQMYYPGVDFRDRKAVEGWSSAERGT